jgi:hypothetical protein
LGGVPTKWHLAGFERLKLSGQFRQTTF